MKCHLVITSIQVSGLMSVISTKCQFHSSICLCPSVASLLRFVSCFLWIIAMLLRSVLSRELHRACCEMLISSRTISFCEQFYLVNFILMWAVLSENLILMRELNRNEICCLSRTFAQCEFFSLEECFVIRLFELFYLICVCLAISFRNSTRFDSFIALFEKINDENNKKRHLMARSTA